MAPNSAGQARKEEEHAEINLRFDPNLLQAPDEADFDAVEITLNNALERAGQAYRGEIQSQGFSDAHHFKVHLGDKTRKERKGLLIASSVGIGVTWGGFIPTQISALGIVLSSTETDRLILLLLITVLYFAVSFLTDAINDLSMGRVQHSRSALEFHKQESEESEDEQSRRNAEEFLVFLARKIVEKREEVRAQRRLRHWNSAARISNWLALALDLGFPLLVTSIAVPLLCCAIM